MELPPNLNRSFEHLNKVCQLKKSLYGPKQSPRTWFGRFTKFMRVFGYIKSNYDHTLFLKRKKGKITMLIIYVDDRVVIGDVLRSGKHCRAIWHKNL